jgi:hypothetical protein
MILHYSACRHMCPKDFAIDCIINTVLEPAPFLSAKVNCEFEKSAQMSHLCRFHPFGVQTCWGGCLPPLSPPTTERASRSLLWIPLCGTAFD